MLGYNWKTRFIIMGATIFMVAVFAGIGYVIDQILDSSPKGLFLAVIISYPITLWLMARNIRNHFRKNKKDVLDKRIEDV